MRFHHMAIFVAEMEAALHLWRDVLGFRVIKDSVIPDGPAPAPTVYLYPALLDDIFKVKNARSRMAILVSAEGAIIELQQCENPAIQRTPPAQQRYGHTGVHELGLLVTDIDGWFARIREAGYAISRDELIKGAVAMAVPFRAAGGKVMGSLVVYGPSARLDDARVQQIVALLLDASRELSAKAGATTD